MQCQSAKREFLDVNAEENELERLLSEFAGEELKLNMNPGEIPPKIKGIKPQTGFCVKAKDENNGKIFINICHCTDLPEPPHITEAELMEILKSDEPSSYRIPMSLGEPHKEKDKGGNDCTCYDVIINSNYYESIQSNELFRSFLITVSYEGIQDKYHVNIHRDSCIVLKNKSYHGVMPDHHIRCKPLIAELGSAPYVQKPPAIVENVTKSSGGKSCDKPVSCDPEYTLRKIPANGFPTKLIFDVCLPMAVSSESMTLFIGEDRVVFTERVHGLDVDIFLPYLVIQDACYAVFNVVDKVLTLTMPTVPDANSKTA